MADDSIPYKRVLLKISGESLAGQSSGSQGIDQGMLEMIASEVKPVREAGVDVCVVVGGGNIYRGVQGVTDHKIDRATSDYMGMLATMINALALQNAFESANIPCRVMSALPLNSVAEPYIRRRAIHHMENGRVVIFAAGTGNPFFTTDTAAALRASEMGCSLLLKATKVKGVYCSDPLKNEKAVFYPKLTYDDVLSKNINVMDATAITLTRENGIPIAVFSIFTPGEFLRVLQGIGTFSLITNSK